MVAGAGIEPADLRIMRPPSQTLLHSRVKKMLEAKVRFELTPFCLQDRRSCFQLSYFA